MISLKTTPTVNLFLPSLIWFYFKLMEAIVSPCCIKPPLILTVQCKRCCCFNEDSNPFPKDVSGITVRLPVVPVKLFETTRWSGRTSSIALFSLLWNPVKLVLDYFDKCIIYLNFICIWIICVCIALWDFNENVICLDPIEIFFIRTQLFPLRPSLKDL